MQTADIIGIIASIISTVSFIPQAYKIFQSRATSGVSLLSFWIVLIGGVCWSLYGWMIKSYQVLFTNAFVSMTVLFIIITTFYFRIKNNKDPNNTINIKK